MFITDEDYKVVIGDSALKVVSQTSEQNRANAEAQAQEEISSYLRPTYDCEKIFATSPPLEGSGVADSRNRLIVMYTCDIALYHMVSAMPQKLGSEVRKERYERAIKWLEGVQAGKIIPDLPLATDDDGETISAGLILTSQKPLRHNW